MSYTSSFESINDFGKRKRRGKNERLKDRLQFLQDQLEKDQKTHAQEINKLENKLEAKCAEFEKVRVSHIFLLLSTTTIKQFII